jgi:hypothetical protein
MSSAAPHTPAHASAQWASWITAAEQPLPLSPRDGRCARRVPANEALSAPKLQQQLTAAFAAWPGVAADAAQRGAALGLSAAGGEEGRCSARYPAMR